MVGGGEGGREGGSEGGKEEVVDRDRRWMGRKAKREKRAKREKIEEG